MPPPSGEKVTIGKRGVITIPARLREALGLRENDVLLLEHTEQGLLLRPTFSVPVESYTEERIAEFAQDEAAMADRLRRRPGAKS